MHQCHRCSHPCRHQGGTCPTPACIVCACTYNINAAPAHVAGYIMGRGQQSIYLYSTPRCDVVSARATLRYHPGRAAPAPTNTNSTGLKNRRNARDHLITPGRPRCPGKATPWHVAPVALHSFLNEIPQKPILKLFLDGFTPVWSIRLFYSKTGRKWHGKAL